RRVSGDPIPIDVWPDATRLAGPVKVVVAARSFHAGSQPRLVEMAVAAHRRAHQEAVAFLDDALAVARLDMRMTDDDVRGLASIDHLAHPLDHFGVLVLARETELLRQVAFADKDGADARHLLEDV